MVLGGHGHVNGAARRDVGGRITVKVGGNRGGDSVNGLPVKLPVVGVAAARSRECDQCQGASEDIKAVVPGQCQVMAEGQGLVANQFVSREGPGALTRHEDVSPLTMVRVAGYGGDGGRSGTQEDLCRRCLAVMVCCAL